ncbi:ESPR-type extended signal peptide-containing protein, partial [Roseateles sp.]|uniref:ESPR-type extended signal peptide-containing protein n=1 Tax=Roseateles sp. TaxID=1971397 RepID=UPI003918FF52
MNLLEKDLNDKNDRNLKLASFICEGECELMNAHCFKTVFSTRLGALVAVGEHALTQGKAGSGAGGSGNASGAVSSA